MSLLCLLLAGCGGGKKQATVDLNAYLTISANGYSGIGEAVWSFDTQAALLDTPEAFGLSDTTAVGDVAWTRAENALNARIGGELDKSDGLKNGDAVTFRWADSVAGLNEDFEAKFTYSDLTLTVEDLTEVETFDAFENLVVTFTGVDPNGYAKLDDSGCKDLNLSYSLDKEKNLTNGDVVTVSVLNDMTQYAVMYNKLPEATTKEYTVEGLPSYMTSLDELTEETAAAYREAAEQLIGWNIDAATGNTGRVDTLKHVGYYLLTEKEVLPDGWQHSQRQNFFVSVYEIGLHFEDRDGAIDVTYYAPVEHPNMLINTDISDTFSGMTMGVRGGTVRFDNRLEVTGYQTLDDLYQYLITPDLERYDIKTNIDGLLPD